LGIFKPLFLAWGGGVVFEGILRGGVFGGDLGGCLKVELGCEIELNWGVYLRYKFEAV